MKNLVAVIALAVILLSSSPAWAHWGYVAPGRVYAYYPVAPAYAYAPPPPMVPVVPAPMIVPRPVVYPYPLIVRPRVYYYGQPVRNAARAVWP